MQNNNQSSDLIIARGLSKKDGKKPGQVITKLFYDAEATAQLIEQLTSALNNQQDGVSITLLEGDGKNGRYAMLAASPMEVNPNRPAPKTQAPVQAKPAFTPKTGGYQPKTPGYAGRK